VVTTTEKQLVLSVYDLIFSRLYYICVAVHDHTNADDDDEDEGSEEKVVLG
jgi:hypothetical protein